MAEITTTPPLATSKRITPSIARLPCLERRGDAGRTGSIYARRGARAGVQASPAAAIVAVMVPAGVGGRGGGGGRGRRAGRARNGRNRHPRPDGIRAPGNGDDAGRGAPTGPNDRM